MTPLRRFCLGAGMLGILLAGGTAGYMYLEGWPVQQALYMTVITLSTVGFGEAAPLSVHGKWFTIAFIGLGFTAAGVAVAGITAFLVQGELKNLVRGRRVDRQIERLQNHYVLCGCGAVGREIALEFTRANVPFVIVEISAEEAQIPPDLNALVIEGDASSEDVLRRAGVARARGLIAAMGHDPENVFVTLTARQLNPDIQIVARANEKGTESKLLHAGADRVISPFEIAGRQMASTVLRPSVLSFLDTVVHAAGVDLHLEEVSVDASSTMVGHTLRESNLGNRTGCIIVAVHGADGQARSDPGWNTVLSTLTVGAGDRLIALGSDEQICRLEKLARAESS